MKTYTSIREAVSDLKARTGHGYVSYFVNGTQVGAADYRMAEGEETIYRSGLEIRAEYRRTVKSGGMYTTRDVYGNPRFIIHFLDLVHEDHPGDHCDKMEKARRMANKHGGRKYRGRVFGGGFVFQAYGLDLLIDELYNDIYKKDS